MSLCPAPLQLQPPPAGRRVSGTGRFTGRGVLRDLQLAAELGKTLLDRNTELEDSLQQMYTTNQEQLQEIEYLSKQVDLLRQMNEQHAKVYEQLDITARDLEETNQRLVADSKASQHRVLSLTETIEGLQANIDQLQSQVEELKSSGRGQRGPGTCDQKSAPSFSCLKELYDLRQHFVYDHVFAEKITSLHSEQSPDAEEHEHLKRASEPPCANGAEELAPDSLFVSFKGPSPSLLEEVLLAAPEAHRRPLKRSSSETVLSSLAGGDVVTGHEETCIRRAKAVRQRGVSLLQEVDTQYSALKVKYEELLRKCQREEDALSHKAVQTARTPAAPEPAGSPASTPPPEYKALFQEIFSCIKKTQQEIDEQRARCRSRPSQASPGLQPSA
ncbi:Cerebellar degeneration-related protein 2 [Pteropus alecto]|uniref:Cerebellar degeneration-related protein 2 n=1 Tax=Pteropus alecto TaxID=9402 RepID=L5KMU8_PTEAL|nr:Cerebellar degeneration-related protein 2 [Pteropus alecto]